MGHESPRRPRLLGVDRTSSGVERAVDDELRFHFDMTMRELMAGGMNPDEALRDFFKGIIDYYNEGPRLRL